MGSPLGPVLAGMVMVKQENPVVPKLNNHLRFWKCYVDDTLTIVKEGSINHVLQQSCTSISKVNSILGWKELNC